MNLDSFGGRKFLMAIMLMIAGVLIEIYSKNGLSTNMAGMLAAIYATFSASNVIASNKALNVESTEAAAPEVNIDEIKQGFAIVDKAHSMVQQQLAAQAEQINVLQKALASIMQK